MNILSQPVAFKILGRGIKLKTESGLVINQKEWTSHHNGSWATQNSEIHMLDVDGREFMWKLTQVPGIRPGHVLTQLVSTRGVSWGIYNHNLDELLFFWEGISRDLAPSRWILWALVLIFTTLAAYQIHQASELVSDWIIITIATFVMSYIALSILFLILRQTRKIIFKLRHKNNIAQAIREHGDSIKHQLLSNHVT